MRALEDFIGLTINGITILGEAPRLKSRTRRFMVRCHCGKVYSTQAHRVSYGGRKSCGCIPRSSHLSFGESTRNSVLTVYRSRAKSKGIPFTLTDSQFFAIVAMDCFYCGSKPSCKKTNAHKNGDFVYNTIDRVDSSLGYTESNSKPSCWVCNRAKQKMSLSDFNAWMERLIAFRSGK